MTLTDTITIMATDDDVSHSLTMNLYHVSAWTVGVEARPTPVFPWHSLVPFLTNVPQSPKDKNKPEPSKGKLKYRWTVSLGLKIFHLYLRFTFEER